MGDNTNSTNAVTGEQLELFEARLMKQFDDRLQQVLQQLNPLPPPPPTNQPNGGNQAAGQPEASALPEHVLPPPPPNDPPVTGSESNSEDASYRPSIWRRPRTSRNPSRNHNRNPVVASRRS